MSAVAQPDYAAFSARYPNLATVVNEALYDALFAEAGLYLNNVGSGQVADSGQQLLLMNMLVAHLAALSGYGVAGQAAGQGLVGRVSEATEGSVTVRMDLGALPGSAAWYAQTPFGLAFWAATAPYRTMHYVPAPCDTYYPVGFPGAYLR